MRAENTVLRPLPLSDPFISLTSFDARTRPEPTDRPSLELCFFLAALSIYNFLLGLELGQDVKVSSVELRGPEVSGGLAVIIVLLSPAAIKTLLKQGNIIKKL